MKIIDDSEIQQIVQRVLHQAMALPSQGEAKQTDKNIKDNDLHDSCAAPAPRIVAIGADHGGFELKEILKEELAGLGYDVIDVGTHSKEPIDYPDIALAVANLVSAGKAWRGMIVDGAGIGSCMVANKIPGVRAGLAYDYSSALNSREHNDANVLTLGAGLIGVNLARQIVKTWLAAAFSGGRHARRVEKIAAIEKLYLKQEKAE